MAVNERVAIIGIDSLDPDVILRYRSQLPNLSRMIDQSHTLSAKSVFPVDTIPAWASVYTGLLPANHGLLYVYDVFDPHLSDLAKLDLTIFKGKTFWDYAGQEGRRAVIVMPHLAYPAWDINGVMVGRSPFEKRIDWLRTMREVSVCPRDVQGQYAIPNELADIWGQFPGKKHLREWAALAMNVIKEENNIALQLFKREEWELFFVYYSVLDTVQHRLWRFFDQNDPTYPGKNPFDHTITDFYTAFDSLIGEFQSIHRNITFIVMSDHGHHMRPIKTINVNEYLRRHGYVASQRKSGRLQSQLGKLSLEVANRLHIEPSLMRLLTRSKKMTQLGKSVYSSSGSIDQKRSAAFMSTFAGIKSYSHGGIEINKETVSSTERSRITFELKELLQELRTPAGDKAVTCLKLRDELSPGDHRDEIYPDLLFELQSDFGVGWELYSGLFGKAHDHNVASGGHFKDATFLLAGTSKEPSQDGIRIVDVAPTILDLLGVDWRQYRFDGRSIFV